ncbi:hypothetical protein P4S55_06960 [Shewanella sp. PP-Sp27a-2]
MYNANILDGAITIEALQHSSLDQGFAAHRAIKQAQGLIPIVLNICSFSGSSTRFRQGEGLKA